MHHIQLRLAGVALAMVLAVTTLHQHLAGAAATYASRILTLSEPEGAFDTDNLISNEATYLEVVPTLVEGGVKGGAYVGVGPDQNFSYIAHIRPAVAYIIDVRRDNLLLHLLFKALFAEAATRVEYLALLTGRAPPAPSSQWKEAPLEEILDRLERAEPRPRTELQRRLEARIRGFGVPLVASDLETVARFHAVFIESGFRLQFRSHGRAPNPYYPTFRELLLATDRDGRQWSYLASHDSYQFVRTLQARDAVVPVVGDVSGAHALRAIGGALAADGIALSAFYISNVEDYLFRGGRFGRFVENLATLPRTSRSMMIRSLFRGGPSRSLVQSLDELMDGVAQGRYGTYPELFSGRRR